MMATLMQDTVHAKSSLSIQVEAVGLGSGVQPTLSVHVAEERQPRRGVENRDRMFDRR
jgi:hypothetical protein